MGLSYWESLEQERENILFDYLQTLADKGKGFLIARYGHGYVAFRNREGLPREDLGNFYVTYDPATFTSGSNYRLVGQVPVDGGTAYIYNSPP